MMMFFVFRVLVKCVEVMMVIIGGNNSCSCKYLGMNNGVIAKNYIDFCWVFGGILFIV